MQIVSRSVAGGEVFPPGGYSGRTIGKAVLSHLSLLLLLFIAAPATGYPKDLAIAGFGKTEKKLTLPKDSSDWIFLADLVVDRHALIDTLAKAEESKDIRRLKSLRTSIIAAIADIDKRISRIDSAKIASHQNGEGLGAKLLDLIANNFRERKLTWLKDTRLFLSDEKDQLDAVISGVAKASAFTSSRLDAVKIKLAAKLKGLL